MLSGDGLLHGQVATLARRAQPLDGDDGGHRLSGSRIEHVVGAGRVHFGKEFSRLEVRVRFG